MDITRLWPGEAGRKVGRQIGVSITQCVRLEGRVIDSGTTKKEKKPPKSDN